MHGIEVLIHSTLKISQQAYGLHTTEEEKDDDDEIHVLKIKCFKA